MQNLGGGAATTTVESVAPDVTVLQAQMASLKAELEAIRQTAAPGVSDGSAELMPGLLEAELAERRAQLELEYEERKKAADTRARKHTETMKQSLNTKLRESKQDQSAAMEKLRTDHSAEVEKLKIDHANQLQQLNGGDGVAPAASEEAKPEKFEPTEQQIKDLVAHNPTVLDIVKRNVQVKLRAAQDQLRADFDKKAQEAEASVQKNLENAVSLERKRQNVKLTMAERRAKEASVRVEFIERAANDTPTRPVGEVWSVISSKVKGVGSAADAPPSIATAVAEQLGNPATALGDANPADEPVAMTLDNNGDDYNTSAPQLPTARCQSFRDGQRSPPATGAPLAKAAPTGSIITTGPAPAAAALTRAMAPPGAAPPIAPTPQASANPSGVLAPPKRRPSGVPFAASQAATAGAKGSGQQKKRRAPSLPSKPAQAAALAAASGSAIPRPGAAARGRGSGAAGGAGRGGAIGAPAGAGAGTAAPGPGTVVGVGRGGSGIPRGGVAAAAVRGRGPQRLSGARGALNPNARQWTPGSVQVAGAATGTAKTGAPGAGSAASNAPMGAGLSAAGPAGANAGGAKAAANAATAGSKRAHDEAGVGGQTGNAEKRARNDG